MFSKLDQNEVMEVSRVWFLALKQLATEAGKSAFFANEAKTAGQKEYHVTRMLELLEQARGHSNNLFGGWGDADREQWDHYFNASFEDMKRRYPRG